ncbi:MAG: hypothetical protein ACKVOU_05825 [Cytophagales bacterium]
MRNSRKTLSILLFFTIVSFLPLSLLGQNTSEDKNDKHYTAFLIGKKGKHYFKTNKGKYPKFKADLESKITFTAFAGVMQTIGNQDFNSSGVSENIFAGYSPSPAIGAGAFYNFNSKLSAGARAKYFFTFKPLYLINNLTIEANVKFHLLQADRKYVPYLIAGPNISLISIRQNINDYKFSPDESFSIKKEDNIPINEIHYFNPNVSLSFVPLPGFSAGAGFNFKYNNTIYLFIQGEYCFSFARNNSYINESYIYNKSDFQYLLISAGFNLKFIRHKFLY